MTSISHETLDPSSQLSARLDHLFTDKFVMERDVWQSFMYNLRIIRELRPDFPESVDVGDLDKPLVAAKSYEQASRRGKVMLKLLNLLPDSRAAPKVAFSSSFKVITSYVEGNPEVSDHLAWVRVDKESYEGTIKVADTVFEFKPEEAVYHIKSSLLNLSSGNPEPSITYTFIPHRDLLEVQDPSQAIEYLPLVDSAATPHSNALVIVEAAHVLGPN